MSIAILIRQMAAAGATPEAIALAVEAIEAVEAKVAEMRSAAAERTRRYRDRGGGNIPQEMRARVFLRDNNMCQECGSQEHLQCDHVIPVSKGGETSDENLQVLCRVCNARKRDRIRKRGVSAEFHGIGEESSAETLSLPPSPQTPQPPTHTRVCISTHAREAAEFDRFWAVYPKRVAKDEARKAFSRALKRASADEIVSAVERQRDWEQWVRGFIPNASTWLNQGRWADEEPQTADTTPTRKANDRPDHHTTAGSAREESLRNMYAGAMAAIDERRRDVG